MKGTEREDAMARALDLLPTDDPARSDPRLVRDAALVEEARAAREAAADLWLAISPLRAAPPDLLPSVMEKIGLPVVVASRRQRYFPWIAASGWAAAAVVAVSLWPQGQMQGPGVVAGPAPTKGPIASNTPVYAADPPVQNAPSRERQNRDEAMRLRNTIADLREEQLVSAPRVMSLSAPGTIQPSPEVIRHEMVGLVSRALRHSLVAGRGHAGGPQTLIYEGSGLPDASAFADDESVLMHRNFPEDSWQEYGLLRSDEGNYYDPAQKVLWVPDLAGLGFFGKRTPETEIHPEDYKAAAATEVKEIARGEHRDPQGYLVEDPLTKMAEVFVDGLQAPEEGTKQVLKWTDAAGNSGELEVGTMSASAGANPGMLIARNNSVIAIPNGAPAFPTLSQPQPQTNSASGAQGTFMIMASLSCPSSLASFELVEVPVAASSKKPKRVIVAGGRRRAR